MANLTAVVEAAAFRQRLSRRAGRLAAFWALLGISLAPLFLSNLPPLNDYPNHLARVFIQIYGSSSPLLSEFYRPAWAFQPNLAMDLAVGALGRSMNIELAGKVSSGWCSCRFRAACGYCTGCCTGTNRIGRWRRSCCFSIASFWAGW